jgi:hypothetical protein
VRVARQAAALAPAGRAAPLASAVSESEFSIANDRALLIRAADAAPASNLDAGSVYHS